MFKTLSIFTTCLLFAIFIPNTAFAAHKGSGNGSHTKQTSTPVGNDISYPQCGSSYPTGQAFGIVGVNGGLANNNNTCLASEYSWALLSSGLITGQPNAQLYVNTANPEGYSGVTDWPINNYDPGGKLSPNQGTCTATNPDSAACAWQYGWNMAYQDHKWFIDSTGASLANPIWWLDVETVNSWNANTSYNTADLEGMVAYFQSVGATAGIYSTSSQWNQIVGTVSSTSSLYSLNEWIPGARRLSEAINNCALPKLTVGGKITITQYTSGKTDYDNSCI